MKGQRDNDSLLSQLISRSKRRFLVLSSRQDEGKQKQKILQEMTKTQLNELSHYNNRTHRQKGFSNALEVVLLKYDLMG